MLDHMDDTPAPDADDSEPGRISVLIADDEAFVRQALRTYLATDE